MRYPRQCSASFRRFARSLGWGGITPAVLAAFLIATGHPRAADPPAPANPRVEIFDALKPDQPATRRLSAVLLLGVLAEKPSDAGTFSSVNPNAFIDQILVIAKNDPDADVRVAALSTLGRLNPRLSDVVPLLTAVLANKDNSRAAEREAAVTMAGATGIGARPFAEFTGALVSASGNKLVIKIDDVDKTFVVDRSTGITFYNDKEARTRTTRISLDELDKLKDTRVWVSAQGQTEPLTAVRAQAFTGTSRDSTTDNLENISAVGAALVPLVAGALRDREPAIRRAAANDLLQFATTARDSASRFVTTHRKELADGKNLAEERRNVQRTLSPFLRAFREQSPAIAQAMTEPDFPPTGTRSARLLACQTLEELAALRELLPNASDAARLKEAEREKQGEPGRPDTPAPDDNTALGPIGPLAPILRALETILTNRNDSDVDARIAAIHALEIVGADALPATPALVKALSDPNPFVRWTSARTLGTIEAARRQANLPPAKGAEGAVNGLIALIYNPDSRVRVNLDPDAQIAAIVALAAFETDAEQAVDSLGTVAAEDDFNARYTALSTLKSLWNHGVKKRPAAAVLTGALAQQHPGHPEVQISAAELLGQYGPAAANAVPALRGALNDPDLGVRRAASEAILKITR